MSSQKPQRFGVSARGGRRQVAPGDRITADLLNSLASQLGIGQLGPTKRGTYEPAFRIPIINTATSSTGNMAAGAPISLESPVLTTDAGLITQRAFNAVLLENATTTPTHGAVAVDFIPYGSAGEAYVSGCCLIQLTSASAGYLPAAGIEVLYDSASTGTRYGVVRLGPPIPTTIIPIGGQTLGTSGAITSYGIKKYAGTLASITAQTYNPGTVNATTGVETGACSPAITAWPDGIGYGTRIYGSGYDRVLICNDSRGTMAGALIGGDSGDTTYAPSGRQVRMQSQRVVSVTLADATRVLCYSPDIG